MTSPQAPSGDLVAGVAGAVLASLVVFGVAFTRFAELGQFATTMLYAGATLFVLGLLLCLRPPLRALGGGVAAGALLGIGLEWVLVVSYVALIQR